MKIKIGEYLPKLQVRRWLSCVLVRLATTLAAKRRRIFLSLTHLNCHIRPPLLLNAGHIGVASYVALWHVPLSTSSNLFLMLHFLAIKVGTL